MLPPGWAACAPGLSRRRSPGRWRPSLETDSLRGAQLRGSMAESGQQGPCPRRPPGTPCLGRHSTQCGNGSQNQKEKKRKSIYTYYFSPENNSCLSRGKTTFGSSRGWGREGKFQSFLSVPGFPSSGKFPGYIIYWRCVCVTGVTAEMEGTLFKLIK